MVTSLSPKALAQLDQAYAGGMHALRELVTVAKAARVEDADLGVPAVATTVVVQEALLECLDQERLAWVLAIAVGVLVENQHD